MKLRERAARFILAAAMILTLGGCDFLPSMDFDDYDVSGYIQALMDSSYHNSHQAYIQITLDGEATAKDNNTATVQNISTHFCNAYNLNPNNEQMTKLHEIFGSALLSARYTVKEEQKISTGYTIEVEIAPITNLIGLENEFSQLRQQAKEEADKANAPSAWQGQDESQDEEDGDDEDGYWGEEGWEDDPTPTPVPTASPSPDKIVDSYELYIDKILAVLPGKLQNPDYKPETVVIALDIRQTKEGDLQLDLNQIDIIDQTVMLFK